MAGVQPAVCSPLQLDLDQRPDAQVVRGTRPVNLLQDFVAAPLGVGVGRCPDPVRYSPAGFLSSQTSHTWQPRPGPPAPGSWDHVSVSLPPAVAAAGTSNSTGSNGLAR